MTEHNSSKELEGYFVDYGIDIKEEPLDTDIEKCEPKSNNTEQSVKQVCNIDCNIKVEDASSDKLEKQESSIEFVNIKEEPLSSDTECEAELYSNDSTHNKEEYEINSQINDEKPSSKSNRKRDRNIVCKHTHDLQCEVCSSRKKRVELIRCYICSRKFATQRSLDKHLEIIHSVVNKKPLIRNALPKEAISILRSWFNVHLENPYPSHAEKLQLAIETNLTLSNINDWFVNARRRFLPQGSKEKAECSKDQLTSIKQENLETTLAEAKFIQATSDNLPKIDSWVVAEFISEKRYFIPEEIRRVKALSFDHDSRIGYVELRSENNICTVRCKICSHQNENQQNYTVILDMDEENNKIISVICMECEESLGGCEHVIMFIMWLNKKNEEPAPSSVECYWRKPNILKLPGKNCMTLKELFGTEDLPRAKDGNSFLKTVVHTLLQNDKYSDVPLVQYFREKTSVEMLDLYLILRNFVHGSANDCIIYLSSYMAPTICQEATELTRDRYKSELWFKLRFARVSCSKIYDVAHCQTADGIIKEQVMGTYKYKESEAIEKERTLKNKVITVVETKFNIKCKRTGLILNKNHPILIATPDSISGECVVEIKHLTDEKPLSRYIYEGNNISDKYNAQLQLQMYFSGKKKGIFCVADQDFENNETVIIIVVDFDELFIMHLIKNAEEYWNEHILPILLNAVKDD